MGEYPAIYFAIHVYVEVRDDSVVHGSNPVVVGLRIREFSFLCFLKQIPRIFSSFGFTL